MQLILKTGSLWFLLALYRTASLCLETQLISDTWVLGSQGLAYESLVPPELSRMASHPTPPQCFLDNPSTSGWPSSTLSFPGRKVSCMVFSPGKDTDLHTHKSPLAHPWGWEQHLFRGKQGRQFPYGHTCLLSMYKPDFCVYKRYLVCASVHSLPAYTCVYVCTIMHVYMICTFKVDMCPCRHQASSLHFNNCTSSPAPDL